MKIRALALLALVAACGQQTPDPPIRDIRPTQIERGDKVTVEASGPLYVVGAPTVVTLEVVGRKRIALDGRAVTQSRVLFDADERFEQAIGGRMIDVPVTVSVDQTVTTDKGTEKRHFASSASAPWKLDLFPRTLRRKAGEVADRVGAGSVWEWLGASVEDNKPANTGVKVTSVVRTIDKERIFGDYETPPFDGQISKREARIGQPGGMTQELFNQLDHDHDGTIHDYELDEQPKADGLAAAAGLREGDLVVAANGKAVANVTELERAWDADLPHVDVRVKRATGEATISLPRHGKPSGIPAWIIFAICMAIAASLIALPVPVIGGLVVVWERKISAYMQSRIGPNRVGPGGWLQWLADGLKLIMKEDIVPTEADSILFKASPYLAFVGLFLVFMVIPFSGWIVVADLNIGLLFLLSVTSLVVVSIIMGGWSSNSKWSLLGGMRSAAQIISYELPASVSLLTIATLTGSLSMQAIVRAQGGLPWEWYVFRTPFNFVACIIYFVSALAEGNRTPFDLPEAESELVSGYNTEYSGFRFSLFPLVEWVNLFVIGAVVSTLFFGGWAVPAVSFERQDTSGWLQLVGFLYFLVKIIAVIFVIIWIRWTLPRFRVDQMMNLCWKYFIPISFACFIGMLAWTWLLPAVVQQWSPVLWFLLLGVLPFAYLVKRVMYNRSKYRDLNFQESL